MKLDYFKENNEKIFLNNKLIEKIKNSLNKKNNISIYGPKKSGKTELCKIICFLAKEQFNSYSYYNFNNKINNLKLCSDQLIILDNIENISSENKKILRDIIKNRNIKKENSLFIITSNSMQLSLGKNLLKIFNETYIKTSTFNNITLFNKTFINSLNNYCNKYFLKTKNININTLKHLYNNCNNINDINIIAEKIVLKIDQENIDINNITKILNLKKRYISNTIIDKDCDLNCFTKKTPYKFLEKTNINIENSTILIADENTYSLNSLKNILSLKKFKVLTSNSLKETLEILNKNKIDILFIDIMLLKKNKDNSIENIKKHSNKTIINILYSGKKVDKKIKNIYTLISKPMLIEDVLGTIRKILFSKKRYIEKQKIKVYKNFFYNIIGDHPSIIILKNNIEKISNSKDNVYIFGEIGTGKQHIINTITKNKKNIIEIDISKEILKKYYNCEILIIKNIDKLTNFDVLEEIIYSKDPPKIIFSSLISPNKLFKNTNIRERTLYNIINNNYELIPLRKRKIDIFSLAKYLLKRISILNGTEKFEISEKAIVKLMRNNWKYNIDELEFTLKEMIYNT